MLKNLPATAEAVLSMEWPDYQPHFRELQTRDLTPMNLDEWLRDWSALASCIDEHYTRLFIATTQNTADEAMDKKFNHFVDTIQPQARAEEQKLKQKLLDSGLEPKDFKIGLKKMRAEAAIFSQANLALLAEEQKLITEYNKIIGAQTVIWEGEERTPAQMYPLFLEKDRNVREKAWRLLAERRLQDRQAINELWAKFMDVRTRIAANADQPDYRAYIWQQKFRFDYSPQDCQTFHEAIEAVVVPAAKRVYEKRKQQLGLDSIRPWDVSVDPRGDKALRPYESLDEFTSIIHTMFEKVDSIFGHYFKTMMEQGLLDLESRKNKAPGAYSLGYNVAHQPFIFMSASRTHNDVVTLLHEGGHAVHEFERAGIPYFHERGEAYLPAEFAEVASMGMELLGSPYLTKENGGFYSENEAARARLDHLEGIITFWPYMALVDAFQHWIYENPRQGSDAAKCEEQWAVLWDRFTPYVDYSGLEDAKKTYWHRQMHIHTFPFYYVEYGLAQLGAVQVWANSLKDQKQAVADYRRALSLGATVSLPELFRAANAKFVFDATTLKQSVDLIEQTIAELEEKL